MGVIEDQEAREQLAKAERLAAKHREQRLASDVQKVMELPEARRLLSAFLIDANNDLSPLRPEVINMAHAIGWQDAAGWWLNFVRKYCPERESQMRAEAKRDALAVQTDEGDND